MVRKTAQAFSCLASFGLVIMYAQYTCQSAFAQTRNTRKISNAIALAMSAGPARIAHNATIIGCRGGSCADMNEMAKEQPDQLRAGTNGWTCYAFKDGPMCLDKEWQKWLKGWLSKSDPNIDGTGIAYMLHGDTGGGSNTDPFAMARSANDQWVVAPPHVMVLFQNLKLLDAYPTDPKNGGPWVMWKDTPYAHVMVPVSPTKAVVLLK